MRSDTRHRRRAPQVRRPRDTEDQFERLASGLGDAVERFVQSLDPAGNRLGLARALDDFLAPTVDRACASCGKDACCSSCCRDDDPCPPRCGCERDCSCDCVCCIGDADLVVYTRVGEQRVVPIRIENQRARERDIELKLSDFRTKGGNDSPVVGRIFGPTEFTLKPCSEEEVIVVISVVPRDQKGDGKESTGIREEVAPIESMTRDDLVARARDVGMSGATGMNKAKLIEALREVEVARPIDTPIGERPPVSIDRPDRELPDVDDCHVAIADLCIEGCDARPVRIAVAVLPRRCNTYDVRCQCGCC
ncbi:MAG: hypothetical protein AAFP84_19100 [Actinomycetota bacterium]